MNRTAIREKAFKLIYSLEIQKYNSLEEQINIYFENENITDEEAKKYIEDAVLGIEKNKDEICSLIEKNLKSDWKIDRISKIDLSILKLSSFQHSPKAPAPISLTFFVKKILFSLLQPRNALAPILIRLSPKLTFCKLTHP